VSFAFLVFLWMLAVASPSALAQELTGFWYNDPQRVAALVPVAAVPLVAVGLTIALDYAGTTFGRLVRDIRGRELTPRVALGTVTAVAIAVPLVIYPNQGIGAGAAVIQDRYTNLQGDQKLVSSDKQALFEQMATLLPPGGSVLGSPFTGVQFSRIWSGHDVVIPHLNSKDKPDVELLKGRFKDFMTDRSVCDAVKRLKVVAVVEDYERFWPTDGRQYLYAGLQDLAGTPGLTPRAYSESAVVYTLADCTASAR
jgi:hypothetical protein